MAMVRDPQFWRRFSVAVHQDELSKEEAQKRPELKHSYVDPSSPSMSTIASPLATPAPFSPTTSTTPLSPAAGQEPWTPSPLSSPLPSPPRTPTTPRTPSQPLATLSRQPSKLSKAPPAHVKPKSPHKRIYRQRANSSLLTLGLSGRPDSRFRFWTNIEANPSNRESWLEEQRRKKSKRTFMCWCFWLVFFALVAGIVVTILILKSKGIF